LRSKDRLDIIITITYIKLYLILNVSQARLNKNGLNKSIPLSIFQI
jgi:hypothetical protein